MSSLYEALVSSAPDERRAIADDVMDSLLGVDPTAHINFYDFCTGVIADVTRNDPPVLTELPLAEFGPSESARLVRNAARVRGFLGAIARAPGDPKTIIDAGCGSSGILALAAAVFHPNAEVHAYEINEQAVRCARTVIQLFGLEDRIQVHHEDVRTAKLPRANLGITETFDQGLTIEDGVDIAWVLAQSCDEIMPAQVKLRVRDAPSHNRDMPTPWRLAADIDLTKKNRRISGTFLSNGGGERAVIVYAEYLDARGDPIVAVPDSDAITKPLHLGTVIAQRTGSIIKFDYRAGANLSDNPATLAVVS